MGTKANLRRQIYKLNKIDSVIDSAGGNCVCRPSVVHYDAENIFIKGLPLSETIKVIIKNGQGSKE